MSRPRDSRRREAKEYRRELGWLARGRRYEQRLIGARGYVKQTLEERIIAIKVKLGLSLDAPFPETLPRGKPLFGKPGRSKTLRRLTSAPATEARARERLRLSIYRAQAETKRRRDTQ